MAQNGGFLKGAAFLAAMSVVFTAPAAVSQQTGTPAAKPRPRLVFSLTTGPNTDSNRTLQTGTPDKATTLDTDLELTYSRQTRLQSFDVSLGALWRLGNNGNTGGASVLEPKASVSYTYNDGDTKISFGSSYSKSPVTQSEASRVVNGTISTVNVNAATGSVINWGNQLSVQTGMRDSLGFLFSASTNRQHYLNNTDPGVYDSHSNSQAATLQLRPDPSSEFDLTRSYTATLYDNALATDQKQNQLSLSYQRALSPVLTLNARIDHSHDILGPRNSFEAGGSLVMPTGKLEGLGGASIRPGYGAQLVGRLEYSTSGPVDSFSVMLSRQILLDADNNDVAYSTLGLNYAHKLNEIANVSFGVTVDHTGKGGAGAATPTDRQSLTLTYTRQLTPDWALRAGYLFHHLRQSGIGDAASNAFFVNIGRKFVLWP